jgi:hypothetical protein
MAFLLLPDHFEKMADNRGRGDNALIVCDGDPYITDARYMHCSHEHARSVLSAYELVIQTPTKGTSKRAQEDGLGQTARAGAQNSKSGAPKKSSLSLNHVGHCQGNSSKTRSSTYLPQRLGTGGFGLDVCEHDPGRCPATTCHGGVVVTDGSVVAVGRVVVTAGNVVAEGKVVLPGTARIARGVTLRGRSHGTEASVNPAGTAGCAS